MQRKLSQAQNCFFTLENLDDQIAAFSGDPKTFGNLTRLHIPYKRIWLPDIILYNNAQGIDFN